MRWLQGSPCWGLVLPHGLALRRIGHGSVHVARPRGRGRRASVSGRVLHAKPKIGLPNTWRLGPLCGPPSVTGARSRQKKIQPDTLMSSKKTPNLTRESDVPKHTPKAPAVRTHRVGETYWRLEPSTYNHEMEPLARIQVGNSTLVFSPEFTKELEEAHGLTNIRPTN
jgi:hypothetical protein